MALGAVEAVRAVDRMGIDGWRIDGMPLALRGLGHRA
jgi:hypothetical protein